MQCQSHTALAAALCVLLLPVIAVAAPAAIPNLPKAGEARPSVVGLKKGAAAIGFDGRAAAKALDRKIGEDMATTRGGAEAAIYRRVSPAVVLIVTREGFGSGSLIRPDGTIITNYHVVAGNDEVGVLFKPQQEGERPDMKKVLVAEVIKIDEVADLALVKLKSVPPDLPAPVVFGDFSKVNVGDDVNAIGHPTGETWTYTRGYVSQVRRNYEWKISANVVQKADVIQTQTPINPGNSGGPLLNTKGELVGVNAFKDQGEGLNFAVALSSVQEFLNRKGDRGGVTVAATVTTSSRTDAESKCQPQATFRGRNKDNDTNLVVYDTDCNGVGDLTFAQPDDRNEPAMVLVDENENGKPEGAILSYKHDETFNISYWDSNEDGQTDIVGYHPDGSIRPSSFGPYVQSKNE